MARRFTAAHQFLRARLIDEIFPIAASLACWTEELESGVWQVRLSWPEIAYSAQERFTAVELRTVYGRWSDWARRQALDIAGELPV